MAGTFDPTPENILRMLQLAEQGVRFSQDEVAEVYGVSRQAIYLAERKALQKIKEALEDDPYVAEWAAGQ
jgi:transcriptional regulator